MTQRVRVSGSTLWIIFLVRVRVRVYNGLWRHVNMCTLYLTCSHQIWHSILCPSDVHILEMTSCPNITLTLTLTIKDDECRTWNSNSTIVAATCPKIRRIAATIVGLGFLDTALYLNQYSEPASCVQFGLGPSSLELVLLQLHDYICC